MTPPLNTSIYFNTSYHDIQHPDTLKMHHHHHHHHHHHQQQQRQDGYQREQQERPEHQLPHQPTIRALVNKPTHFIKGVYGLILPNLIVPLLSLIYFKHSTSPPFAISHNSTAAVANTTPFSTLIGQLFFGYLGNAYGRHKFYSLDLMIIIFGTVFCALSTGGDIDGGGGGMAVMQYLAFWRLVLAFGIGSDYPISATIPSGQAAVTSRRRRGGQLITILTSIQGLGNMMASMVTLMVLIRFRAMIVDDDSDGENGAENMDVVWRICIAVGCLPALLTVLIRHTIPAPGCRYRPEVDPQSRFDAAHHSDGMLDEDGVENNTSSSTFNSGLPPPAGAHSTSTLSPPTPLSSSKILHGRRAHATRVFREYCSQRKNLKVLIGTSLSWFLLDLAFHSIALNQSYLLDALETSSKSPQDNNNTTGSNKKATIYHHLWITTLGNILISLLGIVPGYWFAIFSIEKMHHKRTQFLGFAALLFFLTLLSTAFHQLKAIVPLLITTFTVLQFFANLSKSTPFVVPGEVFPVRVRMTAHGVSAGSGKAGAVLVMVMFNRLVEIESPLGEHSFSSSGRSMTTVGVVLGMGMMMTVGALVVAFVFPRGTRRLLSSKHAWSRRSNTGSGGIGGTGSRVPHQSFEIDV